MTPRIALTMHQGSGQIETCDQWQRVPDPIRMWHPLRRRGSADGDGWFAGFGGFAHFFGDAEGFFDQGFDDLGLRDGLDDLALDEDLALAVAGGDAEVGLAGLARAVDDAAHHGDAERDLRTGRRRSRACATAGSATAGSAGRP